MRRLPAGRPEGFTLIEVIGALVVFAVGVLMVISLSGVLTTQLDTAALRSAVAVAVQEYLDSVQVLPYDSVSVGSRSDTLEILGRSFQRTETVLQTTPLVREVQVTVEPVGFTGPHRTTSGFVVRSW